MSIRCLFTLSIASLATSGCALVPLAAEPYTPQSELPPDYAWPPNSLEPGGASTPSAQAKSTWHAPSDKQKIAASAANRSMVLPIVVPPTSGGCLELLDDAGVGYEVLGAKRGVITPVQVHGEIGGIRYVPTGGLPLIVDCRFAVTLARVAPVLRELGVSELYYSGAYVYRMSSKGRLSLHANGLAIDVHEITVGGEKLSVKHSFVKGLGDECESNLPPLNRVACQLKRTHAFRELLTPDYNADHHDHIHLAISPAAAAP